MHTEHTKTRPLRTGYLYFISTLLLYIVTVKYIYYAYDVTGCFCFGKLPGLENCNAGRTRTDYHAGTAERWAGQLMQEWRCLLMVKTSGAGHAGTF